MIRTSGLTKRYGRIVAVDHLELDVRAGDIYGFLGANGSGKTTTVRMLLGLVFATSGDITLFDRTMPKAAHAVLPRVGGLVEGAAGYGHLSGRANLALLDASGRGPRRGRAQRIENALAEVGLAEVGDRALRTYSLGMRQRLGLAGALLRTPELLVLDEPTNGLDPHGIHEIRELLLRLNKQGTTVFLSSHLLSEVDVLCSRVGVLDRGRMVLQDDVANLHRPTGCTVVRTPDTTLAKQVLGTRFVRGDEELLVVRQSDSAALNAELVRAGVRVVEVTIERLSLEQVVLAATGPSGDVAGRP